METGRATTTGSTAEPVVNVTPHTLYPHGKSPIIKGLVPGLAERGKIKIGKKGESRKSQAGGVYQLPVKLDHFVVTTLERGPDGNFLRDEAIHKLIGDKPRRIPIALLFDSIDLSFGCRYAAYDGRTLWCSGDGECAHRLTAQGKREMVSCPCERCEPAYKGEDGKGRHRCKINGSLSCMIRGANSVGGVWKFRTTGYNSTVGILSSLSLIRSFTAGYLAGLPLTLTVQPKVATSPTDGQSLTVYVVGVEFDGTIEELQAVTLQQSTGNAVFRQRLAHVEEEARRLIGVDAELVDQSGDIVDEFYNEAHTEAHTETTPEGTTEPAATAPATAPAAVPAAVPEPEPQPRPEATEQRRRGRPKKQEPVSDASAGPVAAAPAAPAAPETPDAVTVTVSPDSNTAQTAGTVTVSPDSSTAPTAEPETLAGQQAPEIADFDMGF